VPVYIRLDQVRSVYSNLCLVKKIYARIYHVRSGYSVTSG
jgi:hypothetical protein